MRDSRCHRRDLHHIRETPRCWRFSLTEPVEAIPQIGDHDTAVLMHNDGVAQGLSEVPFMQDVERWGVLTIGTGLGNARFTNRRKGKDKNDMDKDDKKEKKSRSS